MQKRETAHNEEAEEEVLLSKTHFGGTNVSTTPMYMCVHAAHTLLGASSIKLMTMITHNEDYHELNRIGGIARITSENSHKTINLKW